MYYAAMRLQWKLRELLEAHQITAYALAQQLGGHTRLSSLYAITSNDPAKRPRRVAFETLEGISAALREMTGQKIALTDLLDFVDESA
jgi:hypothetical protein